MSLKWKLITRMLLAVSIMGLLLFVPAGSFRFWEAWAFLGIWIMLGLFFTVHFYKRDPEFVKRRLQVREKVKKQKVLIGAAYVIFVVGYTIPGFDFRFGWTCRWAGGVPLWLQIASLVMLAAGYLITVWVGDVNRYASRTINVEAGQTVVSTGPYKWVRHPMYFGALIALLFTSTALGSYFAVPLFALAIPLFALRLLNEEKILRVELPGYGEYCARTRYHLLPYVW